MSCENSARKRSKTMAFRCTPEEYELIANMAAWSGMSRQDYIMARLTGTEITVRPSSRTQRALRDSMKGLAERLLAVCDADELDADLQRQLALVMEIFNGLGEGPQARCMGGQGNQRQFDEKGIYYFHQKGGTP